MSGSRGETNIDPSSSMLGTSQYNTPACGLWGDYGGIREPCRGILFFTYGLFTKLNDKGGFKGVGEGSGF